MLLAASNLMAHYGDGGHHAGGFWPIFPLLWVLFFIGLFFVLGRRARYWKHGGPSGQAVLAERYARGEISEDEYRTRLSVLRSSAR